MKPRCYERRIREKSPGSPQVSSDYNRPGYKPKQEERARKFPSLANEGQTAPVEARSGWFVQHPRRCVRRYGCSLRCLFFVVFPVMILGRTDLEFHRRVFHRLVELFRSEE